ncbi:MAG: type II secretion system F family protein [Candidatus Pacearchaeota archaeon]|jgi:Flp pilus assembly protein TadB
MSIESLEDNIKQMKEIIREAFVFVNQLNMIEELEKNSEVIVNKKEKLLLSDIIDSLSGQIKILNNSIPDLIQNIGFYKKLDNEKTGTQPAKIIPKLVKIQYNTTETKEKISLTISDKDKKEFIENLSKTNLSINQLKQKFAINKELPVFGKPNKYAKLSNKFFRNLSNSLLEKGYFKALNKDLRRMNSPFIVGTYVSMIFFTALLTFLISLVIFITLLFVKLSINYPFFFPLDEGVTIISRITSYFWIIFAIPLLVSILFYYYPSSEAKGMGSKIEQELPFVTIHMSAVATSGVEPMSIFRIILKSDEYRNTNIELTKLVNLINFHGRDLVTALKETARASPSQKLKELLDGMSTAITSGGSLKLFLNKHAENLLFDYKLERERYTKTSETFMDLYISICIAAPMILLMLFVIMGSTGTLTSYLGLGVGALSFLLILAIAILNLMFLLFLKMKQPTM